MKEWLRRFQNWTITDPFRRFVLWGSLVVLVSCVWHVVLLYECWACRPYAWQWMRNEPTFCIVHPLFFSIAVGLFAATLNLDYCLPLPSQPLASYPPCPMLSRLRNNPMRVCALLGLWALMIFVAVGDINSGQLSSYDLLDPCARIADDVTLHDLQTRKDLAKLALEEEQKRRQPNAAGDAAQLPRAFNEVNTTYETFRKGYEAARKKVGLLNTLERTNGITLVGGALTLLFELFIVFVLWYIIIILANQQFDPQLLGAILAFSFWFPARIYANYCEAQAAGRELDPAAFVDAAFAFAVVLTVIWGCFAYACIRGEIPPAYAKWLLAANGVVIGFMALTLPAYVKQVKIFVDSPPMPRMLFALCVLASIFLFLLARLWLSPLSRYGWMASASSGADNPMNAIRLYDSINSELRWTSGKPQAVGDWFQVDVGTPQLFRTIVLTLAMNGPWRDDYPRGYRVQVSNDAVAWQPVITGTGHDPVTTICLPKLVLWRYLRIELTCDHPAHWWSIQDLNLYRQER
jgi:hypothetical protein